MGAAFVTPRFYAADAGVGILRTLWTRVQSSPSNNAANSTADSRIMPSITGGHRKLPCGICFHTNTRPLPSQIRILIRSARFALNTSTTPENGSSPNTSAANAARPCGPLRKSTGRVASSTRTPAGIEITSPTPAPPATRRRVFLPESWTDDPERMARARVPKDRQAALTKPEIAIEEIDRVIASGARFGCVLADAGYGSSGPFRQALSERGLLWAVGLSRRQNVYPADVALNFPVAKVGKPRKYHIPDQPPVSAEALLARGKWQKVSWRRSTKGRLTCLFAARRVRVADGHKHRMLDNRMQCMPGEEVWLVGERRSTGQQKYYVSNLPADTTIKTLAATIKARWVCEQAHQQLKEELGLDHFEGRSWTGLHRHALMTMIAYAFLQSRRLKAAGRKKKSPGTTTTTKHAGHQASDPRPLRTTSTPTMSSL